MQENSQNPITIGLPPFWKKLSIIIPVLSALVAGISSPLIIHYLQKRDIQEQNEIAACKFDTGNTRLQLQYYLTNTQIPYYGNSDDGNVRPQMIQYLNNYRISKDPRIQSTIDALIAEVNKRSTNPNFFHLDNEFRTMMEIFTNKMGIYIQFCTWE